MGKKIKRYEKCLIPIDSDCEYLVLALNALIENGKQNCKLLDLKQGTIERVFLDKKDKKYKLLAVIFNAEEK